MEKFDARHLADGKTIYGRNIYVDGCAEQNWLRVGLGNVQAHLVILCRSICNPNASTDDRWRDLSRIVSAFKANLSNPVHYEDNKPGLFTSGGQSLLPNSTFTYRDLHAFGVSGPSGLAGFLEACELPSKTTHIELMVAAGLLLIDDAVTASEIGRESFSAYLMQHASECMHDALFYHFDATPRDKVKSEIRARLSHAGRASGVSRKQTAKAKPDQVKVMARALLESGKGDRDISAIIAARLGVTSDYVRKLLNRD